MRKIYRLLSVAVMLLTSLNLFAQEKTVTGTVLANEDNTPLIGVTVTNTSTDQKTTTNAAGYFSIKAASGQTLAFTYIGFARQTVVVGTGNLVNVKLVSNEQDLGNVVVTAYGQARNKRELAYQAPVVKGEEVAQTRRENFLNALNGRVPGLTVTSTSGVPGASAQIVLRGGSSIGSNNQPLFVVDGVPQDNSTLNQESLIPSSNPNGQGYANRNGDYTNRIADINPEDIESITILKGPEAAALYGSDGAAGAIVITTKKGAAGRSRVSYDNSFGFTKVYRYADVQDVYSRGTNGTYNPSAYGTYGFIFFGPKYAPNTQKYDNIRNFFKSGFSQQHNISVEGGTPDATFRFSTGYFDQSGIVPSTGFERLNFRLTGSARMSPKVNMSSSWAYTMSANDKASKGQGSYYTNLLTWPHDDDIRSYLTPTGGRRTIRGLTDFAAEIENPFWDVNKNDGFDRTDRLTGNVNITATPLTGLTLNTTFGLDHFTTEGYNLIHPQSRFGYATRGFLSNYTQNFRSINGIARATYKRKLSKDFENTLTAGFFFEDSRRSVYSQRGERFFEPDFNSINNTDPLSRDAKLGRDQIRKIRFLGQYVLGYKNLAYLTFSGTREGVSTLASAFFDKQPFFNYGSGSFSFVFSDLMRDAKWLNYGKLRASYASTGKAPLVPYIIDYQFGSQITTGGGYALGVYGNNFNLEPEYSKNFEVGTELKFLKNRLGFDVAYFINNAEKQIISNRSSYGTGFVLKYINGGRVQNKGIEVQVTGNPIERKNFNWDVTVNFDKANPVVKAMPADLPFYYDSDTWLFGNVRSQQVKGRSLWNLAGPDFLKNDAGQLIISPTTGLPVKSPETFSNIGDRNPDFKIGVINSFTFFRDLNLSFNIDIRKGGDVFNANELMMIINGNSLKTLDREQSRVITGVLQDGLQNTANPTPNTIAITPYYRNDYYNAGFAEADFVEEVNWVRMRDITLGYRMPQAIVKRQTFIKSASIFVTATDVFMITNYSGVDPNVNSLSAISRGPGGAGIDFGAVPTPRTINIGLKASF